MRTFITYLLSALFLLFFAETKVLASTQNSQVNFTSQTVLHDFSTTNHAEKCVESKFTSTSLISQLQELSPSIEQSDDDIQLSDKIDLDTCVKLLSIVLVLHLTLKGLRKKRFFYNKTIKFSSCKYILLRTIRI
ncbi:hypothetical protein SAMN05421738_10328 [Algoriella xinjiangensis]|uniref:Uncharacterized protein n=1 Tax=Algoriella xinjiangensis TaxID=684065 RepID=A0A1I4U1I8_9FLAO|nr:hypothetical protein [Algoriella xinjiangensis]SFM82892.1 hypothetical protein SAMN05421738_10328 [Algoriella xinjiangensis]VDH17789.1 Uncharacterised protein [Algoriella xinjiangensis]